MSMKKIILLISLVTVLSISFLAIVSFSIPISTNEHITGDKAQIWRHRTNDLGLANIHCQNFEGLEIDVVYEEGQNYFDIRHELDEKPSQLNLQEIFEVINKEKCFIWIDLKNLSVKNVQKIIVHLNELDKSFQIKKRIIIESPEAATLNEIGQAGYFTSYWVPHYTHSIPNYMKFYMRTRINLHRYTFTALSAHAHMLPFLEFFYPKANYHVWTHGKDQESERSMIDDLMKNVNVKVILVDFDHDI